MSCSTAEAGEVRNKNPWVVFDVFIWLNIPI
ncbi:predicted protein [Sclerotinia sclerotiorum 1980 UF-70]|uniref:Uncharacterized protein n=1 Tax=Sclerotinia sclerotiorum (strain ATCC 18683 / 1980 / Ss-1) TaxID=665079 RepID=A7ELZ9_SCLS1|nr:predicted protein [Sclerotinia sclerotiorum 1980 UF-70]EDO03865.1 predicted protein [Sclerotinia sclerotiorum 1980 UF-70]